MTPESFFTTAGGLRIHYLDWGGTGQPVILAHPTGFLAWIWQPLAEALRQAGYHPIAFDARGHGDSDKPPDGYRFDYQAADLSAFCQSLGLSGAVGIGHSGGATSIAICGAENPDAFDQVVLIDPIAFPNHDTSQARQDHSNSLVNRALKRKVVWPSRDELFASYQARPPFNAWRPDILRLYVDHGTRPRPDGQIELKCPPELEAQIYQNAPALDPWPAFRRLTVPALIIRGEDSQPVGPLQGEALREAFPQGELLTIANAGHFVPMEQPEAVETAVLEFLGRDGRVSRES